MRNLCHDVNISVVTRGTTHLQLAIHIDSEPISGSVTNGSQRSQPFTGWIELVAAIEAARSSGDAGVETLGVLPGARDLEL